MFSASRITRLKDRSSDSVLCTSATFSKPARSSRISFSYMCMTMSLSSAWIAAMPPSLATTFNTSQISPNCTMRPLTVRPNVGGEHLDRGVARLDRLGQRPEMRQRRLAAHQQVHPVVAIAGAGPLAPPCLDRLLKAGLRRAIDEIEHRCRAAKKRRAADLVGWRTQHVFVAAGKRDRRQAVNMRIDAAGDDDLARRVDDPLRRPGRPQATRRADRNDLLAGNCDVDG